MEDEEAWKVVSSFCEAVMLRKEGTEREREANGRRARGSPEPLAVDSDDGIGSPSHRHRRIYLWARVGGGARPRHPCVNNRRRMRSSGGSTERLSPGLYSRGPRRRNKGGSPLRKQWEAAKTSRRAPWLPVESANPLGAEGTPAGGREVGTRAGTLEFRLHPTSSMGGRGVGLVSTLRHNREGYIR